MSPQEPATVPVLHGPEPAPRQVFSVRGKSVTKLRLAIFIAIFAVIGTALLYFSHAAVPVVATVQAEQMTLPAGTSIITDSTADNSQYVKFTASGPASKLLSLPSQATSLVVRAKGGQCDGAPTMAIKVNGAQVLNIPVSATAWTDYPITVDLAAGTPTLTAEFTNPYTKYHGSRVRCQRSLQVDKLTFYGPDSTPVSNTTVTLNSIADTYVSKNNPTLSYGSEAASRVDSGDATPGDNIFNSYLKFDLGEQAGKNISAAKLRIYVNNQSADKQNIASVADNTWTETMNYNNRAAVGTVLTTTPGSNSTGWTEVDVSSYVVGKGGQLVSFELDQAGIDGFAFDTREAVNKPQLVLTTSSSTVSTPAPTVTLKPSPASVTSGGSSTLTWSSTNAVSCQASGAWTGAKAVSGSVSTGALSANSSYGLSCTGDGGTVSAPGVLITVSGIAACPSWANQFGTFGVDSWPDACWRPYADSSPWNTPIPANPRLVSNSGAMVNRLNGFGLPGNWLAGNSEGHPTYPDFSHPTYYSKDTSPATGTDPLFTLHCTKPWGTCPMEGQQLRLPDAAKPAAGDLPGTLGDDHFTIIDQKTKFEYSFWQVTSKPAGGGTLAFSWWEGRISIDGDGLNGGGTAMHSGMAGMIRAQELAAGKINHAIFMVANCSNGQFVFPASHGTGTCSDPTNAPPLGTRFQLNLTPAEIDGIKENGAAIPNWKKTLLKGMAEYGAIFGDGGGGTWGLGVESDRTYTSFGKPAKLTQFAIDNGWYPNTTDNLYVGFVKGGTLPDGSPWTSHLRVIDPCVSQKTCL